MFTLSQLLIFTNSSFNISFMSSYVFSVVYRVVSSAKIMNLNTVLEWIMSFMYMIIRRGPNMEPCGTPTVMSFFVDCVSFIST